jgi:hypothetical protein
MASEKLNASLKELVSFFEAAGVKNHTLNLFGEYSTKHQVVEFLMLAENFGKCNAFVDHDQLLLLLLTSWSLLLDGHNMEKKAISRRVRALKEDKKTDPEVLARLEHLLSDIEIKKANESVNIIRLRAMIEIPVQEFKSDPNFDYVARYKENCDKKKALREANKK